MVRAVALWLACMLPLAPGGGALADPGQAPRYMVEMEVWIDGEHRGDPIVVVEPGKPASVEVGDPAGEEGWRLELLVQTPEQSGAVGGNIWLELAVYSREDGELSLLADSLLGVPEGRSGVLSVVGPGQEGSREPSASLVHVSARSSILRPGQGPG